ncbi:pyrroline-5-carboxylate reductase dimerization domain-containing protein [Pasteurella multocida]|uniref:pyrroline-5-carboxylate reductase dimerization domain-containing protein n=1 Tax=Pasteurella multocida TaxID=747 RepID=UPI00201274C9|nr:pyrroline-5-carboxylate reductase dimerization domain-containing protein [Pasteurella multocida]
MVMEDPDLPIAKLRENVTSKGDTTAAALQVLNQQHLHRNMQQGMQACVERSQQVEKLF